MKLQNAFTVDVEEYFQVTALSKVVQVSFSLGWVFL